MDCRVCPDFSGGLYRHRGAAHASRPDPCAGRDETGGQPGEPDTHTQDLSDTHTLTNPDAVSDRDAYSARYAYASGFSHTYALSDTDSVTDPDTHTHAEPE